MVDGRPAEIVAEGIHKWFGDNHVLCGVDLTVGRGEIVAIVGGSGCGKTVLLEHIIGHYRPDRGRILVADHSSEPAELVDLATAGDEQMDRIRVHWAVVFQRNALFTGTVYENVALWLREIKHMDDAAIRARARAAVAAVDLDPDTVLGKDREELSGGMAKRVALARALSMEPILMFFDEPTAGLDPHHAARIGELIERTHRAGQERPVTRTTLIITHDKDLLFRLRPRIVMLHEGVVLFDGPYDEFAQSESPVIRPYFALMPSIHHSRSTR